MEEGGPPFVQAVSEQHPDQTIELWAQDETRVGLHGTVARVWAERGSRPEVTRQMEFEWTYVFGAVRPATGERFALVLPDCDTPMTSLFLSELSEHVGPDRHIVLAVDNAPWHGPRCIEGIDNITLLHLPPYSPQLNPVERLWGWLKTHRLSNSVFESVEDLIDRICEAWRDLTDEQIESLCHETWDDEWN